MVSDVSIFVPSLAIPEIGTWKQDEQTYREAKCNLYWVILPVMFV